MPTTRLRPNAWLWTLAASGGLVWGAIAVIFAAVGPSEFVPRIFFSYHIEHFVAFYVLTILAAAGFARTQLYRLGAALALMALVLALVRSLIPHHRINNAEDLAADLTGILAAVLPILVGRFRQVVAQPSEPKEAPSRVGD